MHPPLSHCGQFGPTCGRRSCPKHVEELVDLLFSFRHHILEHIDDVVVVLRAGLDDLLNGGVELLVVPDRLRDVLVDVVHVDILLGGDIPFFELLRGDDITCFFQLLL